MRLVLIAFFALFAGSAHAADVKLLTTGAFKAVAQALVPDFEKQTGHKVVLDNDTAGALVKRIDGGETFDVVVLTPAALRDLGAKGRVAGAPVNVARVAIGVAVKDGAPRPDIATVDAFKRTLLAARKVAYIDPAAGGSSGIYLAQLFAKMGIADQIKAKAVLVPGGHVADRVVSGEADLGIHQISEILAVKGAALVGPLPKEIQNYTVYAAAMGAAPRDRGAAQALLAALHGPQSRAVLTRLGMESPE